jgi:hypothetical protein
MPAPFGDVGPDQAQFEPDGGGMASLDAMGADALGSVAAKGEASAPAPRLPDIEYKGDGTVNLRNVSPEIAAKIQELLSLGTQTKDFVQSGMASHLVRLAALGKQTQNTLEQAAQMNLQKAEVLQQHPIIAQLGKTLSAAAANYAQRGSRLTPLIQGIGAYGADFFKDSPESLIMRAASARAQQMQAESQVLNQTEDQRRFQIQQERIDAQIAQQKTANELAQKRETRLDKSGYETQIISLAKGRTAPDQATIVKGALAHDFSPEEAADLAKRAQEVDADSKHERQLIQDAADKKQAARFAQQSAMFNTTTARMFSLEGMREAAAAQRTKDAQDQAAAKAGKISDVTMGKVSDLDAQLKQLSDLEKVIQKFPQYQGPITGRVPSLALGLSAKAGSPKAAEELKFRSDLMNSIQAIVKTHGGGARGYNPTEFKMVFQPLTAAAAKTPAENLANIQSAKSLLLNKLQAQADALAAANKDISGIRTFKTYLGIGNAKEFTPAPASLKAGVKTTFSDGSEWTLENGQPKKLK